MRRVQCFLLYDEYWIWSGYHDTCKKSKELFAIHISSRYSTSTKSTYDRVAASRVYENRRAGIHRKGGGAMTAFEIISIFIGILALLIFFDSLIVTLLVVCIVIILLYVECFKRFPLKEQRKFTFGFNGIEFSLDTLIKYHAMTCSFNIHLLGMRSRISFLFRQTPANPSWRYLGSGFSNCLGCFASFTSLVLTDEISGLFVIRRIHPLFYISCAPSIIPRYVN